MTTIVVKDGKVAVDSCLMLSQHDGKRLFTNGNKVFTTPCKRMQVIFFPDIPVTNCLPDFMNLLLLGIIQMELEETWPRVKAPSRILKYFDRETTALLIVKDKVYYMPAFGDNFNKAKKDARDGESTSFIVDVIPSDNFQAYGAGATIARAIWMNEPKLNAQQIIEKVTDFSSITVKPIKLIDPSKLKALFVKYSAKGKAKGAKS